MIIDPTELSVGDAYRVVISSVVPRPIAWVSTRSDAGVDNLAPFSFFNAVSYAPPMLAIGIGHKLVGDEHVKKDTWQNIEQTSELVVNVATVPLMEQLNQSSGNYPPEVGELEQVGLTAALCEVVAPLRIAECPVSMECVCDRIIEIGNEPRTGLVLAQVVRFHVADEVWDPAAQAIDPTALASLSRLGGRMYATVGEIIERDRPKM